MIYLDHAATTPMRPGVWESMAPFASDRFGNSSGVHEVSRLAKNALEEARETVAALIGATPNEIVFTSGGTESDNLALKGPTLGKEGSLGVVTVATEHEAVLETAYFLGRVGHEVAIVGVGRDGRVSPDELIATITPDTRVVSIMLVNNETGVVHDVAGLAAAARKAGPDVLVHSDVIQAFGSEDVDVGRLGLDLMSVTGHKFGGPKGSGILYVRSGVGLEPLLHGGGQELGRRSGTHDVAGAVGLATAMELAVADRPRFRTTVGALRDDLEKRLLGEIEGSVLNTPEAGRSPHHLNLRLPGVRNETLLMRLDMAGVAASAGSACQSGAATVSHVLEAMGLSASEARESIRLSLGWATTQAEVSDAADLIVDLVSSLR